MTSVPRLRTWTKQVGQTVITVYLLARDPRVPWYARLLALLVAAYALSPIDPIPDFIPVLGLLDELIVLPLGMTAVLKLVPGELVSEHRVRAALLAELPVSRAGAGLVLLAWLLCAVAVGWLFFGKARS